MSSGMLQLTIMKTNKFIIYVKYDWSSGGDLPELLENLENVFLDYNWGGGFKTENFRYDQKYFYCDMISDIFKEDDYVYDNTKPYIQGMISGYLLAKGIEII